jgi:hypothetical protein
MMKRTLRGFVGKVVSIRKERYSTTATPRNDMEFNYSPEMVSFTKSLNNPATYLTVGIVRA